MCEKCLTRCVGIGDKTLCPDCAPEALRENILEAGKAKKLAYNTLIISCVLMFAGLLAAFVAYRAGGADAAFNATVAIALFFGLARLHSVWVEVTATREKLIALNMPQDGLAREALMKAAIAVVFGAFVTPWVTLRLFAVMQHAGKEIDNSQSLLDEYGSSRAERRRRR